MEENLNQQSTPPVDSLPITNIPSPDRPIHNTTPNVPIEKKKVNVLVPIIITLVIIIVSVPAFYFLSKRGTTSQTSQITSPTPTAAAPTEAPINLSPTIENTDIPGQIKFTSNKFKASFLVMKNVGDQETAVTEVDNKIYVYPSNYTFDQGQSVEFFEKSPTSSLEDAIADTILSGYSKENCLVKTPGTTDTAVNYPASYVIASISPNIEFTDLGEVSDFVSRNCPIDYTATNWIGYFLMDKEHPDKFVFFSIGQYVINANADFQNPQAWEDTFRFVD